ncbi:glutamine amidotransferase, partial [Salmonella enterica]|uniref:glutamine amidotransferase n=1 Tax=Salmonella enterica TaxID=28901 RepID=UPI003299762B
NQAVARDDADFVLTINNDTLLLFGEYQQGKSSCFMSDCSQHWGTQQFMSWPFYSYMCVKKLQFIDRK